MSRKITLETTILLKTRKQKQIQRSSEKLFYLYHEILDLIQDRCYLVDEVLDLRKQVGIDEISL
jgi:hypothetical protein